MMLESEAQIGNSGEGVSPESDPRTSFWKTIPGLLTAGAGMITAIAALLTALSSAGLLNIRRDKGDHTVQGISEPIPAQHKKENPKSNQEKGGSLSLARTYFRLPEDAIPNNNQPIGPFCCTGRTATITASDGRPVGYIYFFTWKGQAFNQGNTSFVPDMEVLVSGLADATNPNSTMEKNSVEFAARESAGTSRVVQAGALKYVISLLPTQTRAEGGEVYFDMSLLRVQVEASL